MRSGELWSKRYVVMPYSQCEVTDFTRDQTNGWKTPVFASVEVMEAALPSDIMGKAGKDWFFPARGQFERNNSFLYKEEGWNWTVLTNAGNHQGPTYWNPNSTRR